MEESTRNIEYPHPLARWLRARSRALSRRHLLALSGFLATAVSVAGSMIAIGVWWRDRPPPLPDLRIVELLPDPRGSDEQCERIRVQNFGREPVDLRGWRVRDASNSTWALDLLGTLASGQSATLWREGRGMSLNNTGDTLELVDARGQVLQTLDYPKVMEGEAVLVTTHGVETRYLAEPSPEDLAKEPEQCRSEPVSSLPRSPSSF